MPFHLEHAIRARMRPLETDPSFLPEDVEELENHLRDRISHLERQGRSTEEAFREAVQRMGPFSEFEPEYRKIRRLKPRRNASIMIKEHIASSLRMIRRRRGFTALNVTGLAVGLAGCLLIGAWLVHERSYDAHQTNLYRVVSAWGDGPDAERPPIERFGAYGPATPGPAMVDQIPGVQAAVRFSGRHNMLIRRGTTAFQEQGYLYADAEALKVFGFPMQSGNPETALQAPDTIVLTERMARKYFGSEDPMGQTLVLGNDTPVTVTGVLDDRPSNTHMAFDFLISMPTMRRWAPDFMFESWTYVDFFTYVVVDDTNAEAVQAALPALVDREAADAMQDRNDRLFLDIEPVPEAYLSPTGGSKAIGPIGNPGNLRVFFVVGLVLLLVACINFTNLATARATERAREIGIRKVLGSDRKQLVAQLLAESVGLALASLAVGLMLVALAAPWFSALTGFDFPWWLLGDWQVAGSVFLLTVLVGLLAGAWPAVVLSGFQPAAVLKGSLVRSPRGGRLRKTLVVTQYATGAVLLMAVLVIRDQVAYMQDRDPGFAERQQLVIDFGGDAGVHANMPAIQRALQAHPSVRSVVATRSVPGGARPRATTTVEGPAGDADQQVYQVFEVDFGFIEQLDLRMVAGRPYSLDFPSDSTSALVINEAAARLHGYTDPANVIGKPFSQWGSTGQVIGVVADFHHESMHHDIQPLSLRMAPDQTGNLVVQLETADVATTIAELESLWQDLVPQYPFVHSFLDAAFDDHYLAEKRFGLLFALFSGLALFVACLGLLGTAAFTIQRRTKEIGVRKVLGADSVRISAMLLSELALLTGVAVVIAWPIAWIVLTRWLETFAFHTRVQPAHMLLAGLAVCVVALGTVAWQTLRAALRPAVDSLRTE